MEQGSTKINQDPLKSEFAYGNEKMKEEQNKNVESIEITRAEDGLLTDTISCYQNRYHAVTHVSNNMKSANFNMQDQKTTAPNPASSPNQNLTPNYSHG